MLFPLLLLAVRGDLPVHCLRHQVAGQWRFHLSALGPERTSCGHAVPDVEAKQPKPTVNATSTLDVELGQPNIAKAKAGSEGTWTMVYDEGFYADVDDRTFFAFNHFLLSDPNSVDWFEPHIHGKRVYRSVCGRTEVGWYQDKATQQWGCFVGERTDQNPDLHHDTLSFLHVVQDPEYKVPLSLVQHRAIASKISAEADGWQAGAYPRFTGKSVADLNKMAGNMQYSAVSPRSFLETRTVRRVTGAAEPTKRAAAELPESFDWRNVNGTRWVDQVMDQGDCGSCYVVSSTNMLTARHRIKTKNPKAASFSVNFPLYCADLNQGCQGGYPFLTSLWSQGVGLITTECGGHYQVSSQQECSAFIERAKMNKKSDKCLKKEAAVKDFKYVGGYYGACSEEAMMVALQEGPLTVAIEPAMDFMYYKRGVYRSLEKKKSEEWFKVDHAVMLIGWGVDKSGPEPRKYWLIQNSWGDEWGEDGYVRMARGENESGVEFQALEASVEERGDAKPLANFLSEFTVTPSATTV